MSTWTFQRVQYGWWGTSAMRDKNGDLKQIHVKANSLEEAHRKVIQRKDYVSRLSNGDTRTWNLVEY